ncbi:MAG: hypothetical protein AMXMBFR53_35570 [Gemmatimonadota bacterium]
MDVMRGDVRHALRSLRRQPALSATILGILSLSIGALTAVFSAVDAALFKPLPGVRDPERMVWLTTVSRMRAQPQGLSYPEFEVFRRDAKAPLSGIGCYDARNVSLASGGEPVRLRAHYVGGGYFDVLGVTPHTGRFFAPEELDPASGAAVVILGYALWRDRFGSDPGVVGGTVTLNGFAARVVGVAGIGFRGPELGAEADLWLPLGASEPTPLEVLAALDRPENRFLRVMGRLAPGVSREAAEGALSGLARGLTERAGDESEGLTLRVVRMSGGVGPDVRRDTGYMAGLVAGVGILVLIIACLNVANLLLARAANRQQEISIRMALGSSRARIARLLLTESVVLAVGGGAGGVALAVAAGSSLAAAYPPIRGLAAVGTEPRMMLFVLAVTCCSGILFGALPALRAAGGGEGAQPGRAGRAGFATRALRRLQGASVVGQLGASIVILVAAGQFYSALRAANRVDLGFEARGVTLFSYDLALQNYGGDRRAIFEEETVDRLAALPGVTSVGLADVAPLSGTMVVEGMTVEGPLGRVRRPVALASVSPSYFQTLEIPLVSGRTFARGDRDGAPLVAIVNETAAREFWGTESPLGRPLNLEGSPGLEVVGVVADAKYDEPLEPATGVVYLPRGQRTLLDRTTVLVRAAGGGLFRREEIQAVIREMDPALPIFDVRTLDAVVRSRMDRQDATARLLTVFGVLGLTIAAIGLYGTTSYAVTQRTREFGVRMALGSTAGDVVRSVVGHGLRLAGMGVALGALACAPVAALLSRSVFGVGDGAAATFAGAAGLLTAVTLLAAWVPARRASLVDPVVSLRTD